MPPDLYPTPTRLGLLADVADAPPESGSGARPWRLTHTGRALLNHHRPNTPNPPPQSPPAPPRTHTPTTNSQT